MLITGKNERRGFFFEIIRPSLLLIAETLYLAFAFVNLLSEHQPVRITNVHFKSLKFLLPLSTLQIPWFIVIRTMTMVLNYIG